MFVAAQVYTHTSLLHSKHKHLVHLIPLLFFFFFFSADIKFSDFSILKERPLTLMTMQQAARYRSGHTLIPTTSGQSALQRSDGEEEERCKVHPKSDAAHGCAGFRDSVKLFCDISNPLSPFVLSASHLHVCFSPCCLVFLRISSVSSL